MSTGFSGTGSYPYGPPGRHLIILFTVSLNPSTKPNRLNACSPYSEHVGVKRQLDGRRGEISAL